MVMETIGAGLGGLKSAMEAVKGLSATITEAKVAEAKTTILGDLSDALMGLLDAQRLLLEDTDTIRALEAEVQRLKDWSAEAERYELAEIRPGVLAYKLKNPEQSSEPAHWLCPRCFADRKKSILQLNHHDGMTDTLDCPECQTRLVTRGRISNVALTVSRRR